MNAKVPIRTQLITDSLKKIIKKMKSLTIIVDVILRQVELPTNRGIKCSIDLVGYLKITRERLQSNAHNALT